MKVNFAQLNQEEKRVLARLKATLALQLVEEAWEADPWLRDGYTARDMAIKIKVGGAGPAIGLEVPAEAEPEGRGVRSRSPSLELYFPNAEAAVKVLSGKKGMAIPLPLGVGAFKALACFKRASSKATEMLHDPATQGAVKAKLLLTATLFGLHAIAGESYLARRMHIVPDGSVRVSVEEIEYIIIKNGNSINVFGPRAATLATAPTTHTLGNASRAATSATASHAAAPVTSATKEKDMAPDPIDAELSFSDYRSAIEVLSGARQAVVALGSGQVRIEGLLPLVQGLFAVLDRLSWYLGVEV